MIGGAYPFIILKLQSLIIANFFVELLSLYFFLTILLTILFTLSPISIRIDLSCILLMRLLAFPEENIQIKGQQLLRFYHSNKNRLF